jgi:hypothetical protein
VGDVGNVPKVCARPTDRRGRPTWATWACVTDRPTWAMWATCKKFRISTGPPADPCEKRILYMSHGVASNVGGTDRPTWAMWACATDRPTWAMWACSTDRPTWTTWATLGVGGTSRLLRSTCTLVTGKGTQHGAERLKNARTLGTLKEEKVLPVHSGLCLLPNHWNCLKVTRGHFWGHGEGHGAHPDRLGAAITMAAFITSSNQLCTLFF